MATRKPGPKNASNKRSTSAAGPTAPEARTYEHPEAKTPLRPDVGTQASFRKKNAAERFAVELVGLDVFDPVTMETEHREGSDVPAWFLDTDYNGLCFHVCQAFFPRTAAWDDLRARLSKRETMARSRSRSSTTAATSCS